MMTGPDKTRAWSVSKHGMGEAEGRQPHDLPLVPVPLRLHLRQVQGTLVDGQRQLALAVVREDPLVCRLGQLQGEGEGGPELHGLGLV